MKFSRAYYPIDDTWVDVEFALGRRALGDYRENPCWNSRESFLSGSQNAIRLVPVDNSGNGKTNFFRAWPGDEDKLREEASNLGVSGNARNSEYILCAQRTRNMIDALLRNLRDEPDNDSIELLQVSTIEELECGSDCPDLVIHHQGRFRTEYKSDISRVFIRDLLRRPNYDVGVNDWIIDISKVESNALKPPTLEENSLPDWNDLKILVHNYWIRFREGRANTLATHFENRQRELDEEEASDTYRKLSTLSYSSFKSEIKRMLDQRELSSRVVYDMAYDLFQDQMDDEASRIQINLRAYSMEDFEKELAKMHERGEIISEEVIAFARKKHEGYLRKVENYSICNVSSRSRPPVWDVGEVNRHRKHLIEQIIQNDPSAERATLECEWTRILQQTVDRYCLMKLGSTGDEREAIS